MLSEREVPELQGLALERHRKDQEALSAVLAAGL